MSSQDTTPSFKREIDWLIVVFNLQVAVSCCCGLHLALYDASWRTTIFGLLLVLLSTLGATAGAHRLWAHQSYKATTSLKVFLMICQSLGGQTSIYQWVRLHRLHHKHFQTDLDPWNSQKGFFHCHFYSNVFNLSPAQEEALKEIDMSDLENDKIVMFQEKYYWFLFVILTLLLPINAPVEYWNETILNSVFIIGWLRCGLCYHLSLLIYSAPTIFDFGHNERNNSNEDNSVFFITKSYWLSYHYLNPWDYQTGEYGKYGTDCTSKFIRICAALEYATELKTVDSFLVREALSKSVDEKKNLQECLAEVANEFAKKDVKHYLTPAKYY